MKTRLAKDIGDLAALQVYEFLLDHTRRITQELPVKKWVYYSDFIPSEDIWEEKSFVKKIQKGKDLGERMHNAFAEVFAEGFEKIIIIGSDIFELSTEDILAAFQELEVNTYVIGPALDGGYYLLGMTSLTPGLFQNKAWSTPRVLEDTLTDLEGEKIAILEVRNDVDTLEDILNKKEFQIFIP